MPRRSLLWGGVGGGWSGVGNGGGMFFGNPLNGNDYNTAFNQFGGGMANSAFYGGRHGPVGAFGSAGNVACGTVGLAYQNVPCTGRANNDPQLNAFGIGGRTAPGGVLPGISDSIPVAGSAGSQPYGGSPFANGNVGNYGGFIGGLPSAGGIYGGGNVYGPNVGLVNGPGVGVAPFGRRLLRAVVAAAEQAW